MVVDPGTKLVYFLHSQRVGTSVVIFFVQKFVCNFKTLVESRVGGEYENLVGHNHDQVITYLIAVLVIILHAD